MTHLCTYRAIVNSLYTASIPLIHISLNCYAICNEAPAADVGRLARAFCNTAEAMTSASVRQASKVHESHAARDTQRLFTRFGLKLRVPIDNIRIEGSAGETLPVLRISKFFKYLLDIYPKLLLGGFPIGDDSDRLCEQFWTQYRQHHPTHEVYQNFGQEQWRGIIPILIHGDKGRTYKKSPIFNFSFECPFGLPSEIRARGSKTNTARQQQRLNKQEHGGNLSWTCNKRARLQSFPEAIDEESCPNYKTIQDFIPHNARGSTYMTRFLIAAIPYKILKGHPQVVESLLNVIEQDMSMLFRQGVSQAGRVFRCGIVGVKGDFEFHVDVAKFTRSYQNVGTTNELAFCPECAAGSVGVPGMDMADVPVWAGTCYQTEPWNQVPPLNRIPYDPSKPASLYKRDIFHMLKFGFLRDLCASTIIFLGQMGYFDSPGDSRALDARLERAYSYFKMWCISESKCTTLRKFSLGNFHRTKATKFPFLGGKGADSILCCCFLTGFIQVKLANPLDQSHAVILRAMIETLEGAVNFTGVIHSHGVFLSPGCASFLCTSGFRLLRGYGYLADLCIQQHRKLYALRPKLHYFHHTLLELQEQVRRGDTHILSPSIFNCEANEDFIGRISRLSRRVSPRLSSLRTIQYYLIACKLLFKRAGL